MLELEYILYREYSISVRVRIYTVLVLVLEYILYRENSMSVSDRVLPGSWALLSALDDVNC